ncbi:MAG: hypothetical protein RL662_2167 [Bacteroidota bacterium]|jgi:hypothetical protein
MNCNLQAVLEQITTSLNQSGIVWGVGASVLLHQYGLAKKKPADIDVLTRMQDMDALNKVLLALGSKKRQEEESGIYSTDFFAEYNLSGVEVDCMAGFKINLPNSVYTYHFAEANVPHRFEVGRVSVPFMTLEDWYVLYQLIPNRESKVLLIEDYFLKSGIQYPQLLHQLLDRGGLPQHTVHRTQKLLSRASYYSAHTASTSTGK